MLTPAQRKFLVREHLIAPALVNLAFNALAGWLIFRHVQPLPMFAELTLPGLFVPNFAGDVLGMFFVLPFATCLVVTPVVQRAARNGKVAQLATAPAHHALLRHLPSSTFRRAMLVGTLCCVGVAPVIIVVLVLLGVTALPLATAVWLKALFAAALAALTTPVFALYALADDGSARAG